MLITMCDSLVCFSTVWSGYSGHVVQCDRRGRNRVISSNKTEQNRISVSKTEDTFIWAGVGLLLKLSEQPTFQPPFPFHELNYSLTLPCISIVCLPFVLKVT